MGNGKKPFSPYLHRLHCDFFAEKAEAAPSGHYVPGARPFENWDVVGRRRDKFELLSFGYILNYVQGR